MNKMMRWDPFRELEDMSDRLNRLFGTRDVARLGSGDRETMTVADWRPVVDIEETPEEYLIKAELPEVDKDDVKVSVQDGVLTLEGERRHEEEQKDKKVHRVERFYGRFVRTFTLPENVEPEDVHAEFKDGMLYLRLVKSERSRPRSIEVKVG
jgi:HSP20 family protein